ncbi:MAG: RecX family transcriptional regulator [Acidobacteria bacterium]|nr:RecX family transcriptional regulator [Acidobacteriota bacterium]
MADAYLTGLRMLARRELSEAQLRLRLARRQFPPDDIEHAVDRLRGDRSLDDRRTALACARTEAHVKRRGRLRVLRQVEALGIAREVAAACVAEVFADIDEEALLARALDSRLRGGQTLDEPAAVRRVQRYLMARGFDAARVQAAIRRRRRGADERE